MIRSVFVVAICAFAVAGSLAVRAQAGQAGQRTPAQGAYAADQAARGAALYKMQCVECHGAMLEGVVGPPLAGPEFQSSWAGKSLFDLAEKIRTTMPLTDPGKMTAPQSLDLVAYILQAGKFPAGPALSAATAPSVKFPGGAAAPPATTAGAVSLTATANLAQLMRGVTFPNANIIFNTQLKDPTNEKPKMPVPYDYVLWGQTV